MRVLHGAIGIGLFVEKNHLESQSEEKRTELTSKQQCCASKKLDFSQKILHQKYRSSLQQIHTSFAESEKMYMRKTFSI